MEQDVVIRECVSSDDFRQCIELEREVWKDDDIDIMPTRLYMIAKACNAPTIGAFDQSGKLVGFVHTMIAMMNKHAVYHSHMAAVSDTLRDRDIGYRMKLVQREHALQAGVSLIIWTFDPLQSRNAYLNLRKLGAVIRRYEPNYYGEGLSTVFDSQVPSDRVFAEWWIRSTRVESILNGEKLPEPNPADLQETVEIPGDYDSIRARSLDEALTWRVKVRQEFLAQLQTGRIARAFVWDTKTRRGRYLFGADDEQFHFQDKQDPL
jgi:predicted GNAT superfamily acetyltransferase